MNQQLGFEYFYHVLRGGKPLSYFNRVYMFLMLPALIILYNILPKKIRPYALLFASFVFFWLISNNLIIYLLLSILSIYIAGIAMYYIDKKKDMKLENYDKDDKKSIKKKYKNLKKIILIIAILFNVFFLFFFKYLNFFSLNANLIFKTSFEIVKRLAPIGISFYTLSALSYLVDVYNEKIKADKNIFRVALFLSFFPTIMEGSICRYSDTAESLWEGKRVTYKNFCFGYQRILWGLFKKAVIANRFNILVKLIFADYQSYGGLSVALAIMGYTIMLYMEFSGTMDIVIGSGEIFNVKIPENFKRPFFSKNVSEFWTRWHITLGTWFKDYIFYPISFSAPVKKLTKVLKKVVKPRTAGTLSAGIALFVVWFLNGLWHGAGYTFLVFGLYHFIMIFFGGLFEPLIIKICEKLRINRKNIFYRVFQSVKLTILIFIGEVFFRAPDLKTAFGMLTKVFTNFNFKPLKNGELMTLGLDVKDYAVLFIAIVLVGIIGLIKEKDINIRETIANKKIVLRWAIYFALIFGIIIFGAYGDGYIPVDPIYADF